MKLSSIKSFIMNITIYVHECHVCCFCNLKSPQVMYANAWVSAINKVSDIAICLLAQSYYLPP